MTGKQREATEIKRVCFLQIINTKSVFQNRFFENARTLYLKFEQKPFDVREHRPTYCFVHVDNAFIQSTIVHIISIAEKQELNVKSVLYISAMMNKSTKQQNINISSAWYSAAKQLGASKQNHLTAVIDSLLADSGLL